jgi:hypothetical protein
LIAFRSSIGISMFLACCVAIKLHQIDCPIPHLSQITKSQGIKSVVACTFSRTLKKLSSNSCSLETQSILLANKHPILLPEMCRRST